MIKHSNESGGMLAIIPARGGSKRLPDKNILPLGGKPLIAWTIEAALYSGCFSKVIVSTDDHAIATTAREYGAEVPWLRPEELATDQATSYDMVRHAIETERDSGCNFNKVMLLQPTSPFRDSSDIQAATKLFDEKNANSVISLTECEHSPYWTGEVNSALSMDSFIEKMQGFTRRSQELPTSYRLNGAIYMYRVNELLEQASLFLKADTYAYIMERRASVDIDDAMDFNFAEFLVSNK